MPSSVGSAIAVLALCCAILGLTLAAMLACMLVIAWEAFLFFRAGVE